MVVQATDTDGVPASSFFQQFKNDARYSLQIALILCALFATTSSLVVKFVGQRDYRIHHSIYEKNSQNFLFFQYCVYFSLAISLPVVLDMFMSYFFANAALDEMHQPRDFSRRFVLMVITVPNLFIATEVIPATSIDIVMFYQFTLCYLAIVYRIYTLSSPQKVVCFCSLREIYILLILSIFAAFLYDLSLHDLIGGKVVWKTIFSVLMVLSQIMTVGKVIKWLKFSNRVSEVVTMNILSAKGTLYGLVFAIIISMCMIFIYLLWYQSDILFFPRHFESYYALESIYCVMLLLWTAVRNFEVRKSEIAVLNQLNYNRKMTRSISHEIRTPLNTAFMALDLLIGNLQSPFPAAETLEAYRKDMLEIADSIKEGCDISLSILNQLLTFEKLSAGMMQLENKLISIEQLLDSNMKLFKMQAQQLGIRFRLDVGSVDPRVLLVYVDEHKMDQVIRNLLSNAMKFTPKGGVVEVKLQWLHPEERNDTLIKFRGENRSEKDPVIAIGKERSCLPAYGSSALEVHPDLVNETRPSTPLHDYIAEAKAFGTILISIVDSGPGVTKEDQKKLFHEYVQINPGELQKGQGTGLGLSISKAIVQLHGGTIGIHSAGKGFGSTFFVELPSYRSMNNDLSNREKNEANNSIRSKVSSMFSPQKLARSSSKKLSIKVGNSSSVLPWQEGPIGELAKSGIRKGSPVVDSLILDGAKDVESSISNSPQHRPFNEQNNISPVVNLLKTAFESEIENLRDPEIFKTTESRSAKPHRGISGIPSKIYRVLVVDDSVPNRKMLTRLLQREGHLVTEVGDGTEAVNLMRSKINEAYVDLGGNGNSGGEHADTSSVPFDFILMDYFMIKMNGPEATMEIRKLGYKNPIVGVTGVVGDDSKEFVQAGADLVLSKPVALTSIWKGLHSIDFF